MMRHIVARSSSSDPVDSPCSTDEAGAHTDAGNDDHSTQTLPAGTVLAERYRIVELIGEGGMGEVYLATHLALDKKVAIKVLAPEQMRRQRTVSRFLQEAKAASRIRHPHVVDITDFGESQGRAFLVMEYLQGEDLSKLLKREGRLSWDRARALCVQLLDALSAAHAAGIIHRDIKPHNCFIVPRTESQAVTSAVEVAMGGEVLKVIDFGIAKLRDGSHEQLTRTGAIIGTAEYMSPEQGLGHELDGRSDLYSVGIILYRLLCGQVPFSADNPMGVLYQHIHESLPPLTNACPDLDVPPGVEPLLHTALAKKPDERFANAQEFADALERVEEAPKPGLDRRTLGLIGAVGFGVATLGLVVVMAMGRNPAQTHDRDATTPADSVAAAAPLAPAGRSGPSRSNEGNPDEAGAHDGKLEAEARGEAGAHAEAGERDTVGDEARAGERDGDTSGDEARADGEAVERDEDPARDGSGRVEDGHREVREGDQTHDQTADADDIEDPSDRPVRRPARLIASRLDRLKTRVSNCGKRAGLFPGERVTVDVRIAPSGRPTAIRVMGSHSSEGVSCIESALRGARFGPARRVQRVKHVFVM